LSFGVKFRDGTTCGVLDGIGNVGNIVAQVAEATCSKPATPPAAREDELPDLTCFSTETVVVDRQYVYWTQAGVELGAKGEYGWTGNVQRVPRSGGPARVLLNTNACGLLIDSVRDTCAA
jgi:hypothetical protein